MEQNLKAAIDIGSNTVQMLAVDKRGTELLPVQRFLATTRLGQGINNCQLSQQAMVNTVAVLQQLQRDLNQQHITDVVVVATSAVRDAVNQDDFVNMVKEATGWQIKILAGEEEAYLSFLGAAENNCNNIVVDVGGGSTEVIWHDQQLRCSSSNVGAVRAWEGHFTATQIQHILAEKVLIKAGQRQVIGVGGTVTTVAALLSGVTEYCREAVHHQPITVEQLLGIQAILEPLTLAERCDYSPLLAQRGEIIVDGIKILLAVAHILEVKTIIASDGGILEGILLSEPS